MSLAETSVGLPLNLDYIKDLLGIDAFDTSKDYTVSVLYDMATREFLQYTNRLTLPDNVDNLLIEMTIHKYNRLGSEGLTSQSYSGVSENYMDGYSGNIISALNRYRKVRFI